MARASLGHRSAAPWNPLRCDGTSLPPSWLLSAKLLAFALFPGRLFLGGPPFLPFVPWLDLPFFTPWLAPATAAAFYAALILLMLNRAVQPACLVIAACVFVHVAGHRLDYANNTVFIGVFLLLIGLYSARTGLWPLRIQLALVYGGAGINKALDPDWWNGSFFDTLMIDALRLPWYAAAAATLPARTLGAILGTTTIAVEMIICAALLSRHVRTGVLLVLAFHVAMLTLTFGHLSSLFLYVSIAVTPPFVESSRIAGFLASSRTWPWWAAAMSVRVLPRLLGYA